VHLPPPKKLKEDVIEVECVVCCKPGTSTNTVRYKIYRVSAVWKVEKDIITSITASLIGRLIMYVETFKADVIVVIGNVIMCLTSH